MRPNKPHQHISRLSQSTCKLKLLSVRPDTNRQTDHHHRLASHTAHARTYASGPGRQAAPASGARRCGRPQWRRLPERQTGTLSARLSGGHAHCAALRDTPRGSPGDTQRRDTHTARPTMVQRRPSWTASQSGRTARNAQEGNRR